MKTQSTQTLLAAIAVVSLTGIVRAADDHNDGGKAHADEVKLSDAAVRQNNIQVVPATQRRLSSTVSAPARVAFNAEAIAHVGSPVSGRVAELKVKIGAKVKKWDPLLVVESPELGRAQSELLQRYTDANVSAGAVQPAKDAYERSKKLYDDAQGISLSDLQKREADYRTAVGAAASSKAALRAAENTLRLLGWTPDEIRRLADTGEIDPRFVIRAPIEGQVVEREITLGELVSPDKEKLVVLADPKTVWVEADVPESRIADLAVGSKAQVEVAALSASPITGEVGLISSEIDPTTRAARLRIVVSNPDGKLRPGMFARALIQGTSGESVLAIPEHAVQTVEGKPSVFVPVDGEANTFARREVVVGAVSGDFVPVLSGLAAGENVVVSGSFILKAELGKSEASHGH